MKTGRLVCGLIHTVLPIVGMPTLIHDNNIVNKFTLLAVDQSVPEALTHLGYSAAQVADIVAYVSGTNTFTGAPYLTRSMLLEKGLTESELGKAEKALPGVFDASQARAARAFVSVSTVVNVFELTTNKEVAGSRSRRF
jgi:hypothetical protein